MKRKTLLIVLLTLVILLCGCSSSSDSDSDVPAGMNKFYNEHVDYKAYIPGEWTVDYSTAVLKAQAFNDPSNISITAQSVNPGMTLDSYWKGYEEDFKATFANMEYEGEVPTTTTLSGLPANKYVFTAEVTGNTYKFMQVVCIHNSTVYVITYTSTPDKYESFIEDVYKVLDSFAFDN